MTLEGIVACQVGKAFAARTLPTLQSHLELARTTNDALKEAR